MTMLDFISIGSADLFGTRRERKIHNENIYLQRDSDQRNAIPQQVNQRLRPLGHDAFMRISGLMSHRVMGFELIKPLRDNTCQIDYGYICICTECQTKLTFLISMLILASIITVYRTFH